MKRKKDHPHLRGDLFNKGDAKLVCPTETAVSQYCDSESHSWYQLGLASRPQLLSSFFIKKDVLSGII